MILLSLAVNVLVLIPVLALLVADAPAMTRVFGGDTPSRRLLACVYGAILAVSLALLVMIVVVGHPQAAGWAQALLAVQVIYKGASVAAVGLRNPVIASNLAIAGLHAVTLATS
ncbi:MAG: hypothetical protein R3B09_20130 [Nannocystaceae bacterium]